MKSLSFYLLSAFLVLAFSAPAFADPTSEELYYELDRTFPKRPWQFDVGLGYDFNNPYFQVLGAQLAVSRSLSPFLNVGVTGDFFSTSQKQTARVVEAQLTRHNETLTVEKPQFVVAAQAKLIPLIGYVNLFSKDILNAEIGPILRAGMAKYDGRGASPLFGVGVDVNMESRSGFGFHFSIVGDWEKVDGEFISRIGVRAGPSLRF